MTKLSDQRLKDMAEELPGDIGRRSDQRSRLLCIIEILKKYTDQEHGITISEIRKILKFRSKSGKSPSEPTVLQDLKAIAGNNIPGLQILKPAKGKNDGYKCIRAALSSEEARLLINITKSCKFITQDQCDILTDHLKGMVCQYQQDKICQEVHVEERKKSQFPDIFKAIDVASAALREGKKISFKYCYYDLNGTEQYLKNESNNCSKKDSYDFAETPIGIIYSFNNYYLETWSDIPYNGQHKLIRRLERMRDPKESILNATINKEISCLKRNIDTRIAERFDMMAGERCEIFLKVDSLYSNLIFNRFGYDHAFEHKISKKGAEVGYLRLTVQLSEAFYRWLFGASRGIKLVKPKSFMWATVNSWGDLPTSDRSEEELIGDYYKALNGYMTSLEKALNVCKETGNDS